MSFRQVNNARYHSSFGNVHLPARETLEDAYIVRPPHGHRATDGSKEPNTVKTQGTRLRKQGPGWPDGTPERACSRTAIPTAACSREYRLGSSGRVDRSADPAGVTPTCSRRAVHCPVSTSPQGLVALPWSDWWIGYLIRALTKVRISCLVPRCMPLNLKHLGCREIKWGTS